MKISTWPTFLLTATSVWAADGADEAPEPVVQAEVVEVPAVSTRPAAVAMAPAPRGFTAGWTAEERVAMGWEKLSAGERAALEKLIAKEVTLARQGNVTAFAGTFISRRNEEERTAAGLGALSTSEKYQLDRLVARALATLPAQPPVTVARSAAGVEVMVTPFKWVAHGFVQLEYGWGSGDREYKAATVAVTQENPRTGTAFTFAYTVMDGDNWWRWRDCGVGWRGRIR